MPDKFSLLENEINHATAHQVRGDCYTGLDARPSGDEKAYQNQNQSFNQEAHLQGGQNASQNANEPQVTFLRSGEVISSNFVWQRIFGDDGLGGQIHNLFDLLDPVAAEDLRRTMVQVSKWPHVTAKEFIGQAPLI